MKSRPLTAEELEDLEEQEAQQKQEELRKLYDQRLNAAIRTIIAGMRPPENLTVSEWADRYRRLSSETNASAGAWRTSRTPYLKEIMDAFTDPRVRHLVVVASSQVGKSEAINNMIAYIIDQDPGSILFVHPTTVDAKEYSKLRIAPMIRDCARLKRKVADPKSRDSGNTITQKSYPGGILTLCGSQEAHSLASKPIRYVFGDERDRWATSAGKEGDPWGLATARQITFYNAKAVEVSTPTVKGASAIDGAFSDGTMERWKTQCPHCGEYHEIVFTDIRFEYNEIVVKNKVTFEITSIYYICPGCGAVSTEKEIKKQPSKWEAEKPEAYALHHCRSFWLSSWVSPWATWESTILEFLKAKGDRKKMQVVYNTRFGQLWEDRGDLEDEESMMARREDYEAELPDGVLCLTCGVDTQDDRFEYEVVGYGHFGESWGIKKGVIYGRPDSDEAWAALDDVISHVYKFKNGVGLPISLTLIDEYGHFTQDVRARCLERVRLKIFPVHGRGGMGIPYTSPPKKQKVVISLENGQKKIYQTYVFELGVDAGKQMIMDNLRVHTVGPKFCHFPRRDDYGSQYFKGLLSEHLVYNENLKNPWTWEKIPGHERNEPLDLRNYANAACKILSPDFDALDQRLKLAQTLPEGKTAIPPVRPPRRAVPKKTSGNNRMYDDW